MIKIMNASTEDLNAINKLCSVTFNRDDMSREFTYLFSSENVQNIVIAKYQNQIIAAMPSLPINLKKNLPILMIGAVCVDEKFRGINLCDTLLKEHLKKDFSVMYISGSRSVYYANGAEDVKHYWKTIRAFNHSLKIDNAKYGDIVRYYCEKSKVFNISYENFIMFLLSFLNNQDFVNISFICGEESMVIIQKNSNNSLRIIDYFGENYLKVIEQYLYDTGNGIAEYITNEPTDKNIGHTVINRRNIEIPFISIFYQ